MTTYGHTVTVSLFGLEQEAVDHLMDVFASIIDLTDADFSMTSDTVEDMFDCNDCGVDTNEINEYYMVTDQTWTDAGAPEDGMLCVGCLETRLERQLDAADFSDFPINHGAFEQSYRLQSRLAN